MIIYRETDYAAMSRRTAALIAAEIIRKPDCVLGLATGATPVGAYRQLAAWVREGLLSFGAVTTVNLDEYRGLGADHCQSYRHFMESNLFEQVDISAGSTHLPNGMADDPEAECRRYDALLESLGGTDLQLLGMGRNGHIGFNEPGTAFIRQTHVVDLAQSTIEANARFFSCREAVPRQAITVGIGAIMSARRVVVAVSGADKAEAVCRAFQGPITPEVPASILQLHRDVVLVGDEAALNGLGERKEFR